MIPQPPPGQGPVDPRGAFSPPPAPGGGGGAPFPPQGGMPPAGGMPPMMPFPPMFPPPGFFSPPPKRRGFAGAIFTTLATTLLGLSLMLNIYLLIFSGVFSNSGGREDVIVDGDASQQIAVIPINGEIDDATSQQVDKTLRKLDKDATVKALVLEMNTPGGEVSASDEIYQQILKFKSDKKIPVVVSMGGMATSGGYYISCSGDYIFAEPTTLTGNIGVVLQRFNFSGLMDKYGVQDTSITPAASKYKYSESPFRPETPEARAYLSGICEDIYGKFKATVQAGRGSKLKAPMDVIADGRANPADEALKLGLIDQIALNKSDAYDYAAGKAGIAAGKMHVVRYEPAAGFLSAIMGKFGGDVSTSNSGKDVNVNVDRSTVQQFLTPKLLYLWQGE